MDATAKNEAIAREIINLLAEKKCTVNEAEEILIYLKHSISQKATVQRAEEKLFDCEN